MTNLDIVEKDKMLVTSIFSFSHNVSSLGSKLCTTQSRLQVTLDKIAFENIVEMLVTIIFSFSHNVFYSIKDMNHF